MKAIVGALRCSISLNECCYIKFDEVNFVYIGTVYRDKVDEEPLLGLSLIHI